MKKKSLMLVTPLLLVACVALSAVPALASAISDTLTIYAPNGTIYRQVTATDAQEGPATLFYINQLGLVLTGQFGHATTLCEKLPCSSSSPASNYSDIFGVVKVGTKFYLGFISDDDSGSGVPAGNAATNYLLETGAPVSATKYLDKHLQNLGYTAWFQSDLDAVVPEPASLVLLGTGLIGLAGVARHRMTK